MCKFTFHDEQAGLLCTRYQWNLAVLEHSMNSIQDLDSLERFRSIWNGSFSRRVQFNGVSWMIRLLLQHPVSATLRSRKKMTTDAKRRQGTDGRM